MDKALLAQFNKFTEELKNISKILKVANGFKLTSADPEFKGGPLKGDERKRSENVAKINAKEIAAALGVQFSSSSKSIISGLTVCFDDLGIKIDGLVTAIGAKSASSIPTIIKGVSNKGIALAISKILGWEAFKDRTEEWNASMVRKLVSIRDYMAELVGITQTTVDTKKKKKTEGTGIGSILGGIAGLALLGVGIFLIVQALVESAKVNPMEVVKVLLVVGAFVGLFLLVGMAGSKLKNAALGFAILSATILFLVIPTLKVLGAMDWGLLLNSVLKFGVIALACIVILKLLSMVSPSEVLKSVGGLALFALTIGFVIIPLLNVLNDVEWDKIKDGLFKFGVISLVCVGILKLLSMVSPSEVLKSVGGLALFALTIGFVIIPLLNVLVNTKFEEIIEGLFKFGVISLVCVGILKLLSMVSPSEVLKSVGGLALFALTIGFVIIPLLTTLVNTKFEEIIEGLFKFGVISLVCIGLMKLMSMIPVTDVLKSVGGILLFTLVIGFVVLPVLKEITKYPFEEMLKALGFMGLIMVGIGLIIRLTGEILTRGGGMVASIAGLVAVLAISFLMGYLAEQLNKFASLDWSAIGSSLALALVALGIFGAAVVGIGALVLNPIVAPLLIAGAVAVGGLTLLMGMIADALQKFSTVNGDQIAKVGTGLLALGAGLTAFLVGMVAGTGAGVVGKLTSIFGLDPAAQIKKFESIDAQKIFLLGSGLLFMSQGLKSLSKDIDLTNITNQLVAMVTPLALFSAGLATFTDAYKNLDTAIKGSEINRIYQMKLEADNGLQKALVDLNQKEVEILSAQLDELKRNGEYLRVIASSGGGMGGGMVSLGGAGGSKGSASVSNFATKDSYMNHLKLTTASLDV